ncbi:hypothetical protein, partial [Arenibacterium halophilum]|uniref:hypothetical protein n=1 Tax=Arenibacterium halophilum TaxID=2583821 RepID=UPI001AEDA69B
MRLRAGMCSGLPAWFRRLLIGMQANGMAEGACTSHKPEGFTARRRHQSGPRGKQAGLFSGFCCGL